MAYITQEEKKELAPGIKAVCKKYGVKARLGIHHHSELVVTIHEGQLDLIGFENETRKVRAAERNQGFFPCSNNHYQANPYHADHSSINPLIKSFFGELIAAMKGDKWYDKSDAMTDYFDTAYYLSINVGKYDKGYKLV